MYVPQKHDRPMLLAAQCTTKEQMFWWFADRDVWTPGSAVYASCFSHEYYGVDYIFGDSPIAHWLDDPAWREWLLRTIVAHYTLPVLMEIIQAQLPYAVKEGHFWEQVKFLYGWRTLAGLFPETEPRWIPGWELHYNINVERFIKENHHG